MILKIVDADKVVHVQQLGIPWTPPSNPIFGFSDAKGGSSQMNPNTSIADSSKHGQSKLEATEDKSNITGLYESQVSIKKIKQVFNILIAEMPFLIDKKVLLECDGKTEKEMFTLKIDAVRKALDIENMNHVELLVQTFYDWSALKKAELANQMMGEGEEEEEENISPPNVENRDMEGEGENDEEKRSSNHGSGINVGDDAEAEDEELEIDEDDVVEVL